MTMRLLLAMATLLATGVAHADRDFVLEPNPFVLGQAVDWLDATHVVWHDSFVRDEDADGEFNIYRSRLDGSEKVCLTCSLEGRDQVPVVRPGGDWILFHSWHGHPIAIGAPGFGGIGSDLWVMTSDGTGHTNLTNSTDLHDHFHAYWSPDGKYLVWTALSWNNDEGGNGRSEVRVARFDPNGPSGPRLVDEHVVRPPNGHWYETQWWAPDGSGFLYTETADTAINPELFFCRLKSRARGDCQPVRLTVDPAWDEQAIFTPDMKHVIFMSSRNLPGAHNDWSRVAELLQLPPDWDYAIVLSVFSNNFLQPVFQQPTDLYEMTLRWNRGRTRFKPGPIRRLTTSGDQGWIIPEFAWDPAGKRLLWSQARSIDGVRVDEACVIRRIREAFIARVSGVTSVAQIPFALDVEMREAASELLRDPNTYPIGDGACGGAAPKAPFVQETWIGRYAQ
ncbi:MAG TPA: hypothetical protein VGR62_19630 [Candidatus Binatia bacterium]|nr:hypothetical protein [Candidatus Binatia bacterium]